MVAGCRTHALITMGFHTDLLAAEDFQHVIVYHKVIVKLGRKSAVTGRFFLLLSAVTFFYSCFAVRVILPGIPRHGLNFPNL